MVGRSLGRRNAARVAAGWHHRGMFVDRRDGGERLASVLAERVSGPAAILAIPRGGVLVAAPVAAMLGAELDLVVPRKIGAPNNPELAIGAVAEGVVVIDEALVHRLRVAPAYIEAETARQEAEIARRSASYRGDRPAPVLRGRTVVVVDDGVATGATAIAALRWARARNPSRLIFAAPVGAVEAATRLARECDDVVLLDTPPRFGAVGEWYERFGQVSDEQVRALL